ncbi:hypothetical protein CPB86DRAFT_790818 [Serendipita vermifera]|nr:hypothetical protein CPB86DRAFT_790818 [Serendipita vermifera]
MQNTQNTTQPGGGTTGTVTQVAWQFVVQYYNYMHDKPDQLHRFYTKNSHFLHGDEGEETSICQGQANIHKKIVEIGFKDCKVFIHSVDAHASANNGILVHVIGEISNNNEPWRKFVQAFFLAEQQNGYFVLNANFRYLKEESFSDDEEEGQDTQDIDGTIVNAPLGQEPSIAVPPEHQQPVYTDPHTNGYHQVVEPNLSQPVATTPTLTAPIPVPASTSTSFVPPVELAPPSDSVDAPPKATTPTPEPSAHPPELVEPVHEEALIPTNPVSASPVPAPRKSPSPAPYNAPATTTEQSQPTATTVAAGSAVVAPVAPSSTPSAPSAPKTWASLAATNSSKWGQNVAQEAKGVSTSVPQPSGNTANQPTRERPPPASTPANVNPPAGVDPALQPGGVGPKNIPPAQQHPLYAAALTVTTPLCFVKGVTENITQTALEQVLTTRFGPIKECEIVRSKACAFLEFKTVDSAKKAIIASLHVNSGGEGGIRLDEEKYGSPARIVVETKKERGDRPAPRPRGPASGGEGRGGVPGSPGTTSAPVTYRGTGGRGGGTRGRGDGGRGGKA